MDVISSNMILFSLYPQERPIESILRSCGSCVGPVAARDKFVYHVPDDVWERVVPSALRNRVVCLVCFDDFAAMRRLNYARDLTLALRFAGDAATFELEVRRAVASVYSNA